MENPIAVRLRPAALPEVHQVSIDTAVVGQLHADGNKLGPAVVIARKAAILKSMSAGLIDAADVLAVNEGDWANAILVVLPEAIAIADEAPSSSQLGDADFLKQVKTKAPKLAELAGQTISAIRSAGVDGELIQNKRGRWVNRPLNSFTLKIQPYVGNLHFTIYGNASTYDAYGFLLPDQNSYSRGWVRDQDDAVRLAELVRLSHLRRKR